MEKPGLEPENSYSHQKCAYLFFFNTSLTQDNAAMTVGKPMVVTRRNRA